MTYWHTLITVENLIVPPEAEDRDIRQLVSELIGLDPDTISLTDWTEPELTGETHFDGTAQMVSKRVTAEAWKEDA